MCMCACVCVCVCVCVCAPVHPSRSLDMNSCIFVREGTAQDVLTKHPPERNSHGLAAGTQVHGTNESPRSL